MLGFKTLMRQGRELIRLRKLIKELEIDVAVQKTLKEQHENNVVELLRKVSVSNRKLYDIKYILQTEQNEYTAYRKIKNVIFDDQIKR